MIALIRLFLFLGLLVALPAGSLHAQERPNSPVFKDYSAPEAPRIIRRSTATYKLWELFILNRSANGGDGLAQHELGLRYLTGEGVAPDTIKAAYWIQRAAEQFIIPARFNLGILTYYGWGVAWNPFAAFELFRYAARQNMREAQYILGQFYSDNLVVPQDYEAAKRWLQESAKSGYEPAERMLERLNERQKEEATADSMVVAESDSAVSPVFLDFEEDSVSYHDEAPWLTEVLKGSGSQLRYAFGPAYQTKEGIKADSIYLHTIMVSAKAGSPEAMVLLGKMYEKGIQVPRDQLRAALYYLRGMKLGSRQGYLLLTDILEHGAVAGELRRRATAGDPVAMVFWAGLYSLGADYLLGDMQSRLTDAQAFSFLQRAARSSTDAMLELGLCYYSGRWVAADQVRGIELWREAADAGASEGEVRIAMVTVQTEGDPERLADAVEVLRRASALGSILSDVGLAYCFENGTGTVQSKGIAAGLYRRAAYRGSLDGYHALVRMHDELRPEGGEYRRNDE
ncbi:MAG: sel1 repeat family protein [Ignavibacteria bacterium]|nr:sel1 repeat family protein [Ignavibacteria bacterium]